MNLIGKDKHSYNCYGDNASHQVVGTGIFIKADQIDNPFVRRLINETIEVQVYIFRLDKTESILCLQYLRDKNGDSTQPEKEFEISFWREKGSDYEPSQDHLRLFVTYLNV